MPGAQPRGGGFPGVLGADLRQRQLRGDLTAVGVEDLGEVICNS